MNTSHAHKQVHEMTHTPILRALITYDFEGKSHAKLIRYNAEGRNDINRLLRWALHKGVELKIRAV